MYFFGLVCWCPSVYTAALPRPSLHMQLSLCLPSHKLSGKIFIPCTKGVCSLRVTINWVSSTQFRYWLTFIWNTWTKDSSNHFLRLSLKLCESMVLCPLKMMHLFISGETKGFTFSWYHLCRTVCPWLFVCSLTILLFYLPSTYICLPVPHFSFFSHFSLLDHHSLVL